MRLSEIEGDRALDVLADILEPASEIFGDGSVTEAFRNGDWIHGAKNAIKNHKRAVIEILAVIDGEDPNTYKVNVLTLPTKLVELLNEPMVVQLFSSPSPTESPVGNTSENTTDAKE